MQAMRLCSVVVLAAVLLLMGAQASGEDKPRPNILIFLADDLGYGDLSCYGATDLRSPNVDALAARGMRWTNFYANSPVCSPTRAALMSGCYPDRVGVPGVIRTKANDNWGELAPSAVLLPAVLKKGGYHTALIGKWHLGLDDKSHPNARGFDFFKGFLGDMMDDYLDHRRHGINYMRENQQEIDPAGHATDLFTQWAIDYLRQRAAQKQPFFLYLAYNAPHGPIQPPKQWLDKVKARQPGIDEKRARLVALIEHMDDSIAKVVGALKESGHEQNTLVFFNSDNGGDLPVGATCGATRGGKGDVYEGGIRVPMCAVWPGKIAPQSTSTRIALTMDLFATACAAAGVSAPTGIDGVSLLPSLMEGDKAPPLPQRDLYWVRREGGVKYMGLTIEALRRGEWKIVHNGPDKPFELYNLAADPLEEHDMAAKNKPKFRELGEALRAQIQKGGVIPWQRAEPR